MRHILNTIYLAGTTVDPNLTGVGVQAPPGWHAFVWCLAVVGWFCMGICVGGFLKGGGHLAWMGMKPSQGGSNGASAIMFSAAGTIVVCTAGGLVTAIAALTGP